MVGWNVRDWCSKVSLHIYELDFEHANCELMGQVTMFLNKLSSGSIGMTALKLFMIDKQNILTVSIDNVVIVITVNSSSCQKVILSDNIEKRANTFTHTSNY